MYSARDQVENEEWLAELDRASSRLDVSRQVVSRAGDLFLTHLPDEERSKRAVLAASLYVATLTESERRSQGDVAEAMEVSRLTIQQRWKEILDSTGLEPPSW
ncbi:transcription initiation factor IIB family protein [Haloarculaceae archaeon H-GB2-1]|nr:transcription initiation factor IIB family protein [Haloarculaceae archaeon H-GB1-1]MEA5386026.1 transcription initiation factor IIB family protein [Haloarculaceae archaeon H-GB11]MEA5407531.1 transcription initiation factor IIB family protein [Haloarculaceae archaeon H-GB2-1]